MTGMVTRIRKHAKPHIYLREWMDFKQIEVPAMAERLGIERESMYRLLREPNRIDLPRQIQIAEALGIDLPLIFSPPDTPQRPSIDAVVADVDDDTHSFVLETARRLAKQAKGG